VQTPASDLNRWIPRLLGCWRAVRRPRGGRPLPDRLAPDELREVAGAVERLSRGLTRERKMVGARYLEDEKLLGAYLLFYWPISYLQARSVLGELPRPPRSVLDLGCGPGPMTFAALDHGAEEALSADRSARALATVRTLANETRLHVAARDWNPTKQRPLSELAGGRRFEVVILGHLLNELFQGGDEVARRAALLEEAAGLLAPGGSLLVIEPALRDTSRALLQVRDLLVARGVAVRSPCLFRGACPALVRETDWCHAERPIDPPLLVAEIGAAAGLRKEAIKMSTLVLAPPGELWAEPPPLEPGGRLFRIVSEPLAGKGRLRYMGCGPEGRMGLSLQEKHVAPENQRFEALARGDVVEVIGTEPRGDGIRLGEGSAVKLVAEAGRPVPRG